MPSILILFALSFVVCVYLKKARRGLPLPPGPRKYPIIGNLLHVPTKHQWAEYNRIAKEYNSDILHFQVFSSSIVVLNSFGVANDLLHHRSSLYSSRQEYSSSLIDECHGELLSQYKPVSTMVNELMGWKAIFSQQPYGEQWRNHRRVFWQEFNPEHSKANHRHIQLQYARDLVRRLQETPLDFQSHIRYTIGASILDVVYGLNIQEKEDPNIIMADNALQHLGVAVITGAFVVDYFPILKYLPPRWMPGAGFRILGDDSTRDMQLLIDTPYSESRLSFAAGRSGSAFIDRAFNRGHVINGGKEERVIKETAATAYLVRRCFIYRRDGKISQCATESIRRTRSISGRSSPRFHRSASSTVYFCSDARNIEVGTCRPPSLVADDNYKGYHLPKDSVIFFNIWAMLRDETIFPEPEKFNPSRFLINGAIDDRLKEHVMSAFGFGRRGCPGRHFAQDTLWITIVSLLSVFTISNAIDEGGKPIVPQLKYSADLVRHVLPFKCFIQPRSDNARELIERFCQS
ncbi:cytochrome P450 family protein [Pleurotus pulmonarius]